MVLRPFHITFIGNAVAFDLSVFFTGKKKLLLW